MLRGGSFDQSGASPRLHEEWRNNETPLSSACRIQEVQLPGIDLGPHNGMEAGSIGKAQSAMVSSMLLILFLLSHRHAAPHRRSDDETRVQDPQPNQIC